MARADTRTSWNPVAYELSARVQFGVEAGAKRQPLAINFAPGLLSPIGLSPKTFGDNLRARTRRTTARLAYGLVQLLRVDSDGACTGFIS